MSVAACAEIVRQGDPDRFLSVMAASPDVREVLFPIYAFNVEVARAPWVTSEPHLAEMRVQWWADVLDEIAGGDRPRMHEVAAPLAEVVTAEVAGILREVAEGRRFDCYGEAFADLAALETYLDQTAGALAWGAARALGVDWHAEQDVRVVGAAGGLANWLRALAELHARGRKPDTALSPEALAGLAARKRHDLGVALRRLPKEAYAVSRATWQANRTLRSAAAKPASIGDGTLHNPEFLRRGGLLWRVLTGAP